VTVDEEVVRGEFWQPLLALNLLGVVAGALRMRGRRLAGAALGVLVAAGIVDEIALGPYVTRRLVSRKRTTTNVVAVTGDRSASRTLVVFAHHDAARTSFIFSQRPQKWIWRRYPDYIATHDESAPVWLPAVAAPLLIALGLPRLGTFLCAGGAGIFADMGRNPVAPGANDNLSGVSALVALAERLRDEPVAGLRVMLVSCGAEETLQQGIRAFGRRRFGSLPRERTWFLNLDQLGSPELVPLEGEGSLVMRDYDKEFTDFVCECAAEVGPPLRRGSRAWTSTDGCVPLVAGYRTATLVSLTEWKTIANYHSPTDTPENIDWATMEQGIAVAERVARRLASRDG
jgi:Zn-dependent M28 family amino/carboxypeptidase